MNLYQGQPSHAGGALWACDRRITSYTIWLANITSSDATIRINHCLQGAAAADTNVVVPDLTVTAHNVTAIDLPLELVPGDVLRGSQGSVSAITVTIDGTDGT